VAIAGTAALQIRSLLDRQQYADPLGQARQRGISSASWPLFGLLWPSGALLAARLATHALPAEERILEIGCGLALASLVGHRRGADITASDCHPLAAQFLRTNLRLNGLPPLAYRHGDWAAAAEQGVVDGRHWSRAVHGRYGLIVGSDVLYDRDASSALADFVLRHAAATAEVWIVDPDRGNRAGFSHRMAAAGFSVHESRLDRAAGADAAAYKGRMLTYSRLPPPPGS
jgi:predicted nicotinamide N-methyase